TKLRNGEGKPGSATVRFRITDAMGREIKTGEATASVPSGGGADVVQKTSLRRPHLWAGVADPYLYHVTVDVRDSRGTLLDRVVQPLGLRYFRVDPNQGIFLNGKRYALHGVNRHQDRQNKGWAIGLAEHEQDFALIKEMGSTGIRLSHYQHAQPF